MIVFFGQFSHHDSSHILLFLRFACERGHILASHSTLTFCVDVEQRTFHVSRCDAWSLSPAMPSTFTRQRRQSRRVCISDYAAALRKLLHTRSSAFTRVAKAEGTRKTLSNPLAHSP